MKRVVEQGRKIREYRECRKGRECHENSYSPDSTRREIHVFTEFTTLKGEWVKVIFTFLVLVLLALRAGRAHSADAWEALGPERLGASFGEISRGAVLACDPETGRRVCTVSGTGIKSGVTGWAMPGLQRLEAA